MSNLGDKEGAKEDLLEIVSLNENNFFANIYLAGIYDEEGNYDLALEYFEKVLADKDDYHYAFPVMGKIYYIKGELEKSALMYEKAISSGSKEMTYPLMASICFTLLGENEKAKSVLNNNIRYLDQDGSIYEMYRYYLNPTSPYFVQLAIENEKNDELRDRMKFYLAMMDKISGQKETAAVILSEIAERKGADEFTLAAYEMEKK